MSGMLLGISLGANVVLLIGLLGLLLLGHASLFSSGGLFDQGASTPASTSGGPTATASPTQTVASGGLQVAPSSVHLGCGSGQRTQIVVLQNTGSENVQWQASLSVSTDQAGVQVGPTHGDLNAGASTTVQVRNVTGSHESQGGSSQQGVILFEVTPADAGSPPSVSYTADNC